MKAMDVRVRGPAARVVERMVRAGAVGTADEAVERALMAFARREGLAGDKDLLASLRRQAAERPLGERELADRIREANRARLP